MGITKDNVVGGIGKPVFCLLKEPNMCKNPVFERGIQTGWTHVGAGTFTVDTDLPNFYGDYSGYVLGNNTSYWLYTTPDNYSYTALYRRLIIMLQYYSTNGANPVVKVYSGISDVETFSITDARADWRRYTAIVGITSPILPGYPIKVRIYSTDGGSNFGLRFTKLQLMPFLEQSISLTNYPSKQTEEYEPNYLYDLSTLIGHRRESKSGLEYTFNAFWDYLDKDDEEERQRIVDAKSVLVIPHDDYALGILTTWDGVFKRLWAKNKAVGHQGEINLRSTELLELIQHEIELTP